MSLLYSLAEVALLGNLLLAVFCVAALRLAGGRFFDQPAMLMIALVAVGVGLQELLGVFASWNSGMEFNPDIALLHYSYPRFYNQVQTWSIPAIVALPLVFPGKFLVKVLCLTALALEFYVLLATGGRGSIVAVSLAILTGILFLPGLRKTLIFYPLTGFLAGLMIYGAVLIGHQTLLQHGAADVIKPDHRAQSEKSSGNPDKERNDIQTFGKRGGRFSEPLTGERIWTFSGRLPLWHDALRDARGHPLLGIGPINFACTGPPYRSAHPHNFPLQIAGEWGITALVLLLMMMAFGCIRLWRSLRAGKEARANNTPLTGFLATALLAAAIHACLSGVLVMPASQVTGVLVCGWLLGLLPAPVSIRTSNYSAPVLLTFGLALSASLLAFTWHEFADAELRFEQTPLLDRGIPRLWQNGKVCRLYRPKPHARVDAL
jgi:hypothetical protein